MKQSSRSVVLLMLLSLTVVLSTVASLISAQTNEGVRTANHQRTGKLTYVGASVASPIQIAQATVAGLSSDARASAILAVYAPQFGVANPADLTFKGEVTTRQNLVSRRYQQTYQGIPVFAGELIVNATRDGGLVSMFGEASPDLAVNTQPKLSAAEAQQLAIQKSAKDFGANQTTLAASTPALWIYDERLLTDSDEAAALVWRVEVTSTVGAPVRAVVLVDARKGFISLIYNMADTRWTVGNGKGTLGLPAASTDVPQVSSDNNVETRVPGTADLSTHTANNSSTLPGTFLCNEGAPNCTNGSNPDADAAHKFAKGTYDMLWNWHGRDSLNGAGLQLISSTQVWDGGLPMCNAFWNGVQMAYGNGCSSSIVVDDVVGHELVHGFTEFSSGLIYAYQSGAINESLSDVWGEFYDLTNGSGDDTPANRWRLAEPVDFGYPQIGLRDLQNPEDFDQPDRMLSGLYWTSDDDNGGVHFNSGVNNKAAYLMVDGDTFNGQTITGIGIPKTVAIYYDVQTTKLTGGSEYYDLGKALSQACQELIGGSEGITAADCQQVDKAVLATEMHTELGGNASTAALCPVDTPVYLFNDGLESGGGNWTTGATTGANAWTIASDKNVLVGAFSNLGINPDAESVSFIAMNSNVTIPANAYLHFTHRFSFEVTEDGTYWDGGIIEYSTNGGSSWTQLPSAGFYQAGEDYGGTINADNPLGGKAGFVGRSGGGLASTRYTLNALSGQNVRFRWVIGSDLFVGAPGWRIDDIKIYTCEAGVETPTPTTEGPTPTPTETVGTELLVNGGFETDVETDKLPDGWTTTNLVSDKVKCNTPEKVIAFEGECAFQFKGAPGENSKIAQNPDASAIAANDILALSGYVNAKGTTPSAKIKIRVSYADSSLEKGKITAKVNAATSGWTALSGTLHLVLADTPTAIKVIVQHKSVAGKVLFDDLSLIHATGGAASSLLPLP